MRKIYVLDTNVLLHNADAIYRFEDNEVVIPFPVIEEIDNNKKGHTEVARNARKASRILTDLMSQGNLANGVQLKSGGSIRIELNNSKIAEGIHLDQSKYDNRILSVAYNLQKNNPEKKVVLVSKDLNLRILADVLKIKTEDYKNDKVDYENFYTGIITYDGIPPELIDRIYKHSVLLDDEIECNYRRLDVYDNQFVILKNSSQSALCRYRNNKFTLVKSSVKDVWGIKPLNKEQICAYDLLLDDKIRCVTLTGSSGCGKTLLSLACALQKVIDDKHYKKLMVARPTVESGDTLGLLPGTKREKLDPWMAPIYDNFDFILDNADSGYEFEYLEDKKLISIESIQHMRGCTIPNRWLLIDECQNLSQKQMKMIVTRMGKQSKLVLTGDPEQIDNPYLDASSNGLTYLVEKFKGQKIFGHIHLEKCERSELAEIGAKLL